MSSAESLEPVRVVIQASPAALYSHLVDFRNHVAWNHQLVDVAQTTPSPIQVGTVFEALEQPPAGFPSWLEPLFMGLLRLLGSVPRSRAEITRLISNERIEWLAQSPVAGKADMQVKWQLTFTPQGEATEVSQQFQMYPHSLMARIMTTKSLKRKIAAGCKENLGKLKWLMENESQSFRHC